MKRTCVLCKEPINDPVSEGVYDPVTKKIVYHHREGYCKKETEGPYMFMKRHGQVKHD